MHLIETSHHEVNADGDPDLGLHCVGAGAIEGFDSQVLFDPFEEQLDMPPTLVDGGDGQGRQFELIGQEGQRLTRLRIDVSDMPQLGGIIHFAFGNAQSDDLIATQTTGAVDGIGLADVEAKIAYIPGHEEGLGLLDTVKSGKVDVSTIQYINASGFECNLVQNVHVVDTPLGDADEHGDGAAKVHQCMQLDCRLGLAESHPGKQGQAEIDCRGIKSVHHLVDVQPVTIRSVQPSCFADEHLSQIRENAPVPVLVGVSKIGSCDVAAAPHRIEMAAPAQASPDVPQTLPVSHLRKRHAQKLVARGEGATSSRHRISSNTSVEMFPMKHVHDLRENESSGVHLLLRLNSHREGYSIQMRHTPSSTKDHDKKQLTEN